MEGPKSETDAPPPAAANKPTPPDLRTRIAKLAEAAPNQQNFRGGIDLAVQTVQSAADPAHALATMERTVPGWWDAMRDGRVRSKPLRYVVQDGDWMREAPAPHVPTAPKRRDRMADVLALLNEGKEKNGLH